MSKFGDGVKVRRCDDMRQVCPRQECGRCGLLEAWKSSRAVQEMSKEDLGSQTCLSAVAGSYIHAALTNNDRYLCLVKFW